MYSSAQRSSGHFDTKKDAVNRACSTGMIRMLT